MSLADRGSPPMAEWRVCGRSAKRGDWTGGWRRGVPDASAMYDAQQLADRNDEVWIEKRKVEYRITDQERIPVPAHSAGPTSQYVDEDPERSMQEDRADIP